MSGELQAEEAKAALLKDVVEWHRARHSCEFGPQFRQMIEELGELAQAKKRGDPVEIREELGDVGIVNVGLFLALGEEGTPFQVLFNKIQPGSWDRRFQELVQEVAMVAYHAENGHRKKAVRHMVKVCRAWEGLALDEVNNPAYILQEAYDRIKDREGEMVGGQFVKAEDLPQGGGR